MFRIGVVALILLALSTAAWLWLENRRLRSQEFSPDGSEVVVTLDLYPCDVRVVMNDRKQVDALISKPLSVGIKAEARDYKKLGYLQIRSGKRPITLFLPVGVFEAGDGIQKTNFGGLEEVLRQSLDRAAASF